MLRMDDTDILRSSEEYEKMIKLDLQWLGLNWDESEKQSTRLSRYEEVKQSLIKSGRLYPCYETQNDLDMKRKLLLSRGLPPIYDRSGLKLTQEEHEQFQAKGIKPHYRFLLEEETIEWDDLIRGKIQFQAKNLSDPIVIREDGSMTYILCSAVDDIDFSITHVLRGEDHITNTAIGIQITKAIGATPPTFGHICFVKNKVEKISKRIGGFDIKGLKEQFIEAMTINSMLAKIGTSDSIEPAITMDKLLESFDIKKFGLSAVNYDFEELKHLNHKLINSMTYQEILPSLTKLDTPIDENFWLSVSGNINTLNEIIDWWNICNQQIKPLISNDDKDFLIESSKLLPKEEWNINTWDVWISKIKEKTGRFGKKLFMPIRLAITGQESGPELKILLPLIGQEKTIRRLNSEDA